MEKQKLIIAFLVFGLLSIPIIDSAYAVELTLYNTNGGASSNVLREGNTLAEDRLFVGEEFTSGSSLIGFEFNRVSFELLEVNAPTGLVRVGLWNTTIAPTGGNYICLIGDLDASDIRFQPSYQFTANLTKSSGTCTIQADTALGLYYAQGLGSTANSISWRRSTTSNFDGTNTRATVYDHVVPAWTDITAGDYNMRVYHISADGSDLCDDPANANILICRMGGDGTLGSAGAFVIGDVQEGTGVLGIGCSTGVVDCVADSNPQTNGLGLLIFIASIFVIVGMFFRSLGASETMKIPTFVWVIIIIALSAFFTITQLIDPVFLILSVIALIALASPKIVGMIKGGASFGSGSTE